MTPLMFSESIQLFAGSSEIFNRTVRHDDYLAAGQEIRSWAMTAEAVQPVKQAALYLGREIATGGSEGSNSGVMHGWCIYMSFVSLTRGSLTSS